MKCNLWFWQLFLYHCICRKPLLNSSRSLHHPLLEQVAPLTLVCSETLNCTIEHRQLLKPVVHHYCTCNRILHRSVSFTIEITLNNYFNFIPAGNPAWTVAGCTTHSCWNSWRKTWPEQFTTFLYVSTKSERCFDSCTCHKNLLVSGCATHVKIGQELVAWLERNFRSRFSETCVLEVHPIALWISELNESLPKNKDLITCLTVKVIRMIDLRFFFPATENHDQDPANYEIHVMTLAKCVVKRYFRIRCLSYLKMLNQKHNPDPSIRNAILKKTSVYRFVIKNFEIKLICFVYFICVKFNLNTPAALDFYWSMRHVVRGSGDQAALVVSVAHLLSLRKLHFFEMHRLS